MLPLICAAYAVHATAAMSSHQAAIELPECTVFHSKRVVAATGSGTAHLIEASSL